ncbi:conserved hypothetical protein [Ruegeria lacuscaerulensis ITI-1157]|nr:conserved hypothetical protein [Ruegeria lacuscaerulensis ITI-1157]SHK04692.1 ParB-like nuclease domain-containing protein [Ruegeria lacuscaerulensis ITI-1157]
MAVHKIDISEFEAVPPFPLTEHALPVLQFVPINQMIIDDRYQRSVERRGKQNIIKIARNFDWTKFSPVVLSRRDDGTFAIIDGQHRVHAAALCGISDVPATITNMTIEQEAAAFSWVNGSVTALTPNQIFKAALAAFEPWAVMCDAAVSKSGCRLMPYNKSAANKKPGEVYCVSLIRRFIEADAAAHVSTVLTGIRCSKVKDEVPYYNSFGLSALIPGAINAGVTSPDVVADFLNCHDLKKVAKMVERVQELPENKGRSYSSLFADSVKVLLKKFAGKAPARPTT